MFSFYMQTFLKTALLLSLLSPSIVFANELELEDVPLVPVSGKKAVVDAEEAARPSDTVETHVLNGWSVGGVIYNQSYNVKVSGFFDGAAGAVTSNTADLQNIGVVGRYSVIPVGALGTDFALTLASSANHGTQGYDAVFTTKAEMNFGWGFVTSGKTNYYLLGGFGYEGLNGKELNRIVAAGGGFVQIGGGMVINKKLNFEGFFGTSRHGVASDHYERVRAAGIASGSTTVTFETDKSFVTSYIMSGRLIYKF